MGDASQKPPMSLTLNYESSVIDTAVKEAPHPLTASGGTDQGLPHSCTQTMTPTWPSAATQTTST